MKATALVLCGLALLPACVAPETPGSVVQINEKSVTIRGAGDYSPQNMGKPFSPTPAMQAQAEEICPGARFVSGTPSEVDDPFGFSYINYLFFCP